MKRVFVAAALALATCGGDGASSDAGRADAIDAGRDAGAIDAGRDAGAIDAATGEEDAGSIGDAGLDAGSAEDAGPGDAGDDAGPDPSCGALGQRCEPGAGRDCPGDLACVAIDREGVGVCVASHGLCGGIAGARCPDEAPVCLTYGSASGWPCATEAERDCICAERDARSRFPTVCARR